MLRLSGVTAHPFARPLGIVGLSPRKGLRQDDCKSRKSSDKWQRDEGLPPDRMLLVKWGFSLGIRFHNGQSRYKRDSPRGEHACGARRSWSELKPFEPWLLPTRRKTTSLMTWTRICMIDLRVRSLVCRRCYKLCSSYFWCRHEFSSSAIGCPYQLSSSNFGCKFRCRRRFALNQFRRCCRYRGCQSGSRCRCNTVGSWTIAMHDGEQEHNRSAQGRKY